MAGSGAGGSGGAAGSPTAGSGGAAPPPPSGTDQFNGSTGPWTPTYGASESYSTNDAEGSTSSGSLDLAVTGGSASITSLVAATRCVSTVAGATYDLSAKVFIPSGASGSLAGLGLWYFASNDCSGSLGGTFDGPSIAIVNAWQSTMTSNQTPAGMQSMSVRLGLIKPSGKTNAEALFDDVLVSKH
jgi:hypothetical protein